ncbi:hypothetical protein MAH1_35150 [Sessilibacter sp. MAH1]
MSKKIDESVSSESKAADELKKIYADLYNYDRSFIGRVVWFIEKFYFLLRFTPKTRSTYRLLIDQAEIYSFENKVDFNTYVNQKNSRLKLLWYFLRYVIKHPYSSIRLISRYRILKLFKMLLNNSDDIAANWFTQRFPEDSSDINLELFIPSEDDVDTHEIIFPKYDNPSVSIVIPVYNQYKTTLSCLMSVNKNTDNVPYELIIADDNSSDLTSTITQRIKNIKVVRSSENHGFLGNCNNAVKSADGNYVVLLNNDTNVQSGWLESLLKAIENDASIGLVGPKLLFDDGILQEAGGIVWNDASGWNFGRGQDSSAPEFNYRREVDYISGACLLFRKSLWDKVGGFDDRFRPAYYEDTDLAFQVRALGLKVVYQPQSTVVHFEGISNGTDLGSGIKKYQLKNQEIFFQKWKSVLKSDHYRNGFDVFKARERFTGKTILFIDHYVPFYDKDAGSKSTFLYVKSMLRLGYNVKFLGANFFPHQPYTNVLQSLGVEVIYGERYAKNWGRWLRDNSKYIDIIYLHRPHITEDFINEIYRLKNKPKLVYFGHDLHHLRLDREFEITRSISTAKLSKDWYNREVAIFNKVDVILYPSTVEVDVVKSISKKYNVHQLPLYPLELKNITYKHNTRKGLLFVGGFGHPPNEDGVIWFLDEIFPLVLRGDPSVMFHIVGSNVPDSILSLSGDNIIVHGYLPDDDLDELYSTIRVVVVPLRFGAGIKGKVLEAIQNNIPIVTTSIGAEGLPKANEVMMIEDNPESFSKAILSLYSDREIAENYSKRHQKYIDQNFSQKVIDKVIEQYF